MVSHTSELQEFMAGWCGGCTGLIVGHPFDTVKVRLQTQSSYSTVRYKGGIHCFYHIIRTESVLGFYKGLASPLLGQAVINAIIFGTQGNAMKYLQPNETLPSLRNSVLSGAVAGFFQSWVCAPMELIKIRMQMQNVGKESKSLFLDTNKVTQISPLQCIIQIWRREGMVGLSRGLASTFFREIPAFSSYFATYDTLCKLELKPGQRIDEASISMSLFAGGTAGIVTWLITYPIDVIKSQLQADGADGKRNYTGILDCGRQIYEAEGIAGFKKGLGVTLLRAFPVNAVTFTTVMAILNYLRRN